MTSAQVTRSWIILVSALTLDLTQRATVIVRKCEPGDRRRDDAAVVGTGSVCVKLYGGQDSDEVQVGVSPTRTFARKDQRTST